MGVNAMQCLKCGREIGPEDVFCRNCLVDMANYPIKPGTVVQIPKQPVKKTPERRQQITPERKVELLTRRVRLLSWLLVLAMAVSVCLGALLISELYADEDIPMIGQNYVSATDPEETTEP